MMTKLVGHGPGVNFSFHLLLLVPTVRPVTANTLSVTVYPEFSLEKLM